MASHTLTGQHLAVDWREVRSLLWDVAEVLWLMAVAAFWCFIGATVFGLLAFGLAQNGQWAAGVIVIGVGFASIIYALITWLGRQTMQHVRPGNQVCPWCSRTGVRLTVQVIGHPRPEIAEPLVTAAGVKVCGECAPWAINAALREHQFSSWPVEVLPLRHTVSDEDRAAIAREVAEERTRDAAGLE